MFLFAVVAVIMIAVPNAYEETERAFQETIEFYEWDEQRGEVVRVDDIK